MSATEDDEAAAAPPRDMAELRARLAEADDDDDPSMDGLGAGLGAMILFGCPLGHWLGTDSSLIGGLATGLGIGLVLFVAAVVVSSIMDTAVGKVRSSPLTLALVSLGAGAAWFSMYEPLWVPLAMTATLPLVGFSELAQARRKRARGVEGNLLGLSKGTLKRVEALPEEMPPSIAAIVDRAISNVATIDRYVRTGLVQRAALDAGALQRDLDRSVHGLVDRVPLAIELSDRKDPELQRRADEVMAALSEIADQIASVADGVLLAASAEEADALDALQERAEQLRLMAEGYSEVSRAVRQGPG